MLITANWAPSVHLPCRLSSALGRHFVGARYGGISLHTLQLEGGRVSKCLPIVSLNEDAWGDDFTECLCSISPHAEATGYGFAVTVAYNMQTYTMRVKIIHLRGSESAAHGNLSQVGRLDFTQRLSFDTTTMYRVILYSNSINSYRLHTASLVWLSESSFTMPGMDGELLFISWPKDCSPQQPTKVHWSCATVHAVECTAVGALGDLIITGGSDAALRVWRRNAQAPQRIPV